MHFRKIADAYKAKVSTHAVASHYLVPALFYFARPSRAAILFLFVVVITTVLKLKLCLNKQRRATCRLTFAFGCLLISSARWEPAFDYWSKLAERAPCTLLPSVTNFN